MRYPESSGGTKEKPRSRKAEKAPSPRPSSPSPSSKKKKGFSDDEGALERLIDSLYEDPDPYIFRTIEGFLQDENEKKKDTDGGGSSSSPSKHDHVNVRSVRKEGNTTVTTEFEGARKHAPKDGDDEDQRGAFQRGVGTRYQRDERRGFNQAASGSSFGR